MTRLKLAELTSGIGALVLGVGFGALFPHWFAPAGGLLLAAGGVAHAFGMWDKHRIEARDVESGPWLTALYWTCWLLLAGVAVLLFAAR
jgi:hypothetical protein